MENHLDDYVKAYQGDNIYDFDNEILLTWYPQRVLHYSQGCSSILELGVGHGYTTNIFSNHFKRHVVLDGSRAVIENFRQASPECSAEIVETYFEDFQSDEMFDVIVMGFILEHVDNPVEVMKSYKKFLKPHGKMFLAVPNAEGLNRRLGHLSGMLNDMEDLSDNDKLLGHKRYYTTSTFTKDIETAGYEVEAIEGIYLKPLTTGQMLGLNLDKKVLEAMCEVGVGYPELSCGIFTQITHKS